MIGRKIFLSVVLLLTANQVLAQTGQQAPNASEVAMAYQQYADNLSRLQNRLVSKGTGQDAVLAPDHHYQVVEAKVQTCEKAVGQPGFVCITQLVERLPGMQQTNQRWTELPDTG